MPEFQNFPHLDFSKKENLDWIQSGIREFRSSLPIQAKPIIQGEILNPERMVEVYNPSNSKEIVTRFFPANTRISEEAVHIASQYSSRWRDTEVSKRSGFLVRLAEILAKRRIEFISLMVLEVGKNPREGDADVAEAIDFCRYYAKEAESLFEEFQSDISGEENRTLLIPRGVGLVLAPWNFPLAILCGMTVSLLVTGNTVLVKPAEQSSGIATLFFECLLETGIPREVVHFLPGLGEEIGDYLAKHPLVDIVNFTGSKAVGLGLLKTGAELQKDRTSPKKIVAEMGGKNAIVIDSDADLDEAVAGCIQSAFGYQGQKCSALSRIIVLESCYDRFLERFRERLSSFSVGAVDSFQHEFGPVIEKDAQTRLQSVLERNQSLIHYQMEIDSDLKANGYYVEPTIFVSDDPSSELGQTEFFGPLVAVFSAKDLSHAIEIFNSTEYALTGGIYSRNPESIERAKMELDCGNLYINRTITGSIVGRQPFGGHRLSGVGYKAGGPHYLLQFVQEKTITENTVRRGFSI